MSSTRNNEAGWRGQRDALATFRAWGLDAVLLGEQGRHDEGDIEVRDRDASTWVVECKRAQQVSVRRVLTVASRKSLWPPLVWWQPVTAPRGRSGRRMTDGPPVAALWAHDLAALLSGRNEPEGLPMTYPVVCWRCGHEVPVTSALTESHPGFGAYVHRECADMSRVLGEETQ